MLSSRVVERTKDTKYLPKDGTIVSQKKTGGLTASASFRLGSIVCETRIATPTCHVTCMQSCRAPQRSYCAAVCNTGDPGIGGMTFSRPRSSRERSANATELRKAIVSELHVDQHDKQLKKKEKKKEATPGLTVNSFRPLTTVSTSRCACA